MKNIVSVILGGGKGTRLRPLTEYRSKPAVPVAGKYRLIDVPISNCINSAIEQIYVLTQFNSVSLHRHIRQTYNFDLFNGGFVEILAAQQTNEGTDWYQGTADAVRKQLRYLTEHGIDYVLILSGDQLYRMDYREMLDTHEQSGAVATIAALPVNEADARGFGIMRLEESGRVRGFLEKPKKRSEMEDFRVSSDWINQHGIEARDREYMASMGIYLFSRDFLVKVLEKLDYQDFGKDIFPAVIHSQHVQAHLFDGYWEDIGTIRAFFDASLALANPRPPFQFAGDVKPIYTRARFLPSSRIEDSQVTNSLISDGCIIGGGSRIENCVLGLRCRIGRNVTLKNSVVMGADYYQSADDISRFEKEDRPLLGIGDGTSINGALIDKDVCIGRNVTIDANTINSAEDQELGAVSMRDGIAVVRKLETIPHGWKLGG